jgi:hypothetical protein
MMFHVIIYTKKRSVVSATLATSLAFGAGACGSTPERTPDADLQQAFNTSVQFWQAKGIPLHVGKKAVRLLEIRDAEDEYTCDLGYPNSVDVTPYTTEGLYCKKTNSVVIGAAMYEDDRDTKRKAGLSPEAYAQLIMGHEVSHALSLVAPALRMSRTS